MRMEEPETITLQVHYLESYYDSAIDEDAPVMYNEGDAELEFYKGWHKTEEQDVIAELELQGYLIAKTCSRYEREKVELNY